jgi:glycine/serine hydroxymethyltransferase
MSELAASIDLTPLTEEIDELSTRLILNGVATLTPDDFESFRRCAEERGSSAVADAVHQLAESVAAALELPMPERTRIASTGLMELRRLLDEPSANRQATTPKSASASKTPRTRT